MDNNTKNKFPVTVEELCKECPIRIAGETNLSIAKTIFVETPQILGQLSMLIIDQESNASAIGASERELGSQIVDAQESMKSCVLRSASGNCAI